MSYAARAGALSRLYKESSLDTAGGRSSFVLIHPLLRDINAIHAPGFHEGRWFTALRKVMKTTLPFFSPEEMERLFRDIESAPGYSSLSAGIKQWVTLFKSQGTRDYQTAAELSGRMLPAGIIPVTGPNDYLITINMFSHIALKQYDQALDTWSRRKSGIEPSFLLQLLAGHAESGEKIKSN